MKKYRETDTAIAEAKRHYETFIDDDALALAQLRRDRADHDLAQFKSDAIRSGLAQGLEQGLAQGREQGLAQGSHDKAVEIARNLLGAGLSNMQIAEYTGLAQEEIKSLGK